MASTTAAAASTTAADVLGSSSCASLAVNCSRLEMCAHTVIWLAHECQRVIAIREQFCRPQQPLSEPRDNGRKQLIAFAASREGVEALRTAKNLLQGFSIRVEPTQGCDFDQFPWTSVERNKLVDLVKSAAVEIPTGILFFSVFPLLEARERRVIHLHRARYIRTSDAELIAYREQLCHGNCHFFDPRYRLFFLSYGTLIVNFSCLSLFGATTLSRDRSFLLGRQTQLLRLNRRMLPILSDRRPQSTRWTIIAMGSPPALFAVCRRSSGRTRVAITFIAPRRCRRPPRTRPISDQSNMSTDNDVLCVRPMT